MVKSSVNSTPSAVYVFLVNCVLNCLLTIKYSFMREELVSLCSACIVDSAEADEETSMSPEDALSYQYIVQETSMGSVLVVGAQNIR